MIHGAVSLFIIFFFEHAVAGIVETKIAAGSYTLDELKKLGKKRWREYEQGRTRSLEALVIVVVFAHEVITPAATAAAPEASTTAATSADIHWSGQRCWCHR